MWFDASRWYFNKTVEYLKEPGTKAAWKSIKTGIIHHTDVPERLQDAPYQVKSIAVRDACGAVSNAKKKYGKTAAFQQVSWRSRKNPRQGCFIPATAVSERGAYHTILGDLRMAEPIPDDHRDSRLTLHNGQYHLVVPCPARRCESETQARVVALDPGIRSFLTWFSEREAGHIGRGDFGRIQRLCHHLDALLGKAAKASGRRKRNMYRAATRMRVRVGNLIDELHHQAARFLVDNFDLVLLPTFETREMSQRGRRRLRSKSVRSMLTFAHYRFQQFLLWKAWETGKQVLLVNEAYTSKTCSWSGEIVANLGGRREIVGSDGVRLDRDINGARGIFLRALGDHPSLMQSACIATGVVNVG